MTAAYEWSSTHKRRLSEESSPAPTNATSGDQQGTETCHEAEWPPGLINFSRAAKSDGKLAKTNAEEAEQVLHSPHHTQESKDAITECKNIQIMALGLHNVKLPYLIVAPSYITLPT